MNGFQPPCFKSAMVVCPLTTLHFHLLRMPAIFNTSQEPQSLTPGWWEARVQGAGSCHQSGQAGNEAP